MNRTRFGLLVVAVAALLGAAGCTAGPDACVAWRQTSLCAGRTGTREPQNDRACDVPIETGWSGYCECVGGRAFADCGHPVFTCDQICHIAFGGTTPPPGGDPCTSATSCAACTARSTCGWCNGRCLQGTSSGPTGTSCGGASWAWVSSQCVDAGTGGGDPCASATSCGACTPRAGCGWCPGSGQCLQGTSSGPSSSACSDWRWVLSQCGP